MIKLSITEAQRDTVANALRIAINQYDESKERIKTLNGSTELKGVDWALVEQINKQRRDAEIVLALFLPVVKVRAKPKTKTKRGKR